MRRSIQLLAGLLGLVVCAGRGAAQPPAPESLAASDVFSTRSAAYDADGSVANPVQVCPERWHTDLLLGLPTGLRVQAILGDDSRNSWIAEAFVGVEIILPIIGMGARHRFTVCREGGDCFRISPGVDVYGVYWPGGDNFFGGSGGSSGGAILAVTADVDFSWEHTWGGRLGGELGIKLGGGAAFWGNDTIPIPVLALYGGLHF